MIEFQHIDLQTYTAVQDAITVLESVNETSYAVSKMGQGLGAAYAARLREVAATNVDDEKMELSHAKIVAVCDEIFDMVRVLKWIWGTRARIEEVEDKHIREAVDALETVARVALEPNPDNKQD